MIRALLISLVCLLVLLSCSTQRMICPAYQSAFYFDKSKQKDAFVFYNENKNQPREILASNNKTINLPPRDSTWDKSHVLPGPALPFERKRKKEKYLLLPKRTYKEAIRAMQTVPMKPVYPKIGEDSTDIKKALDSAARSVTDTITSVAAAPKKPATEEDSVYVITKEKEKFNLDQDNYMWYFRDILVLPDVKIAMAEAKAEKEGPKEIKKKKGFFASLKGLFKKKPKEKSNEQQLLNDSTQVNSGVQDSSSVVQPKKKGLLGLFKKKSKPVVVPKKVDGKKEEDDGF
jgi:hypothetical protein